MATQQQKDATIASIKDRFKTVLNYDLEKDLIRKDDLGNAMNFEPLRSPLLISISLVRKLDTVDLNRFTFNQLNRFNEGFGQIHALMNTIKTFSINQTNPQQRRDQLIRDFENNFDAFIDAVGPLEWTLSVQEPDSNIYSELTELISDVKNDNENAKKEAQLRLSEINQILENAKSAAGKVGVASHSAVFKEEAEFHKEEAQKWLNYARNMMIATASLALIFLLMMFCPTFQLVNVNVYQFAISKIVILAIFFIGISICTKNYKAHKHNSIVNKHRQNALSTFETFVKAAGSDEQTKNAILLQTTQSIFASQNTGYNSVDNDSDVPNKIIEIVKSTSSRN